MGFQVIDEYGQAQPGGRASVDATGHYSFMVMLPATRLGQDRNGRVFMIFVTGVDRAGNMTTVDTFSLVPHDMGHGFPGLGG